MEEVEAEEVYQGRDAATLEIVIKAGGPLTCCQLEDLWVTATHLVAPHLVARPSQPSTDVAVRPTMVVANLPLQLYLPPPVA